MTTILIKKKDTAGAPAAGDLTNAAGGAEIAVNTATKRIYTKDSGGNVVEVGTNPTATTMNGNLTFVPDATYDIGATGATRPRDVFMSRNLTVGGTMTVAGGINFNGNVTVGDSSADTLTVNSTITSNLIFTDNTYDIGASGATRPRDLYMSRDITLGRSLGIGAAASSFVGALVGGTYNVSNAVNSFYANNTTGTLVTNYSAGFQSYLSTAAGSYTTSNIYNFVANDLNVKGAGHTVTTLYGFHVTDLTKGGTNVGFYSNVSSGANKWGFFSNGTANNLFVGNTRIGGGTAPVYPLDVTGNANISGSLLLVGTTPAPTYSPAYPTAQVGTGSLIADQTGVSSIWSSNYFVNSSNADSRLTTNAVGISAVRTPVSGSAYFEWYGAANGGTAGNTVTLAKYGTWDANGLAINNIATTANTPLAVTNSSTASAYIRLVCSAGSYDSASLYADGTNEAYVGMMRGTGGGTGNLNSYVGGALRTTVSTTGLFGIGTVSPGANLHVSGTGNRTIRVEATGTADYSLIQMYAGAMGIEMGVGAASAATNANQWYMYDTRNARYVLAVDSNSNFYVGNTGGGNFNSSFAGTNPGLQLYGNFAPLVHNGTGGVWLQYIATGTGNLTWYSVTAVGERMNLTSTGNLNILGAYGYISDRKLKENIVDATPKLADLMRLKIRNYNMVGGTQKMLGFIAQEVEEVFPALIAETPDTEMGTPENGNKITDLGTVTKSIKASVLVPMIVKALQELKAEFDEYKAAHP